MNGNRTWAGRRGFGLWETGLLILMSLVVTVSASGQGLTSGKHNPDDSDRSHLHLAPSEERSGVSRDAIKLGTVVVSIPVTVTDRSGRAMEGLKKEDFKVLAAKVQQP